MKRLLTGGVGIAFVVFFLVACLLSGPGRTFLSERFTRGQLLPEMLRMIEGPLAKETAEHIRRSFGENPLSPEEIRTEIRAAFTVEGIWPDIAAFYDQFRDAQPFGERKFSLAVPDSFPAVNRCLSELGDRLQERLRTAGAVRDDARLTGFLTHYRSRQKKTPQITEVSETVFTIPVFSVLSLNLRHRHPLNVLFLILGLIPVILVLLLHRETPASAVRDGGRILLSPAVIVLLFSVGIEFIVRLMANFQGMDYPEILDNVSRIARIFWWGVFGPPALWCLGGYLLSLFVIRQQLVTDPADDETHPVMDGELPGDSF